MERTKFVLTERNNDIFSGEAQNKGKNPSLQEKNHQYLDRYFKSVIYISEAHFFWEKKKRRRETPWAGRMASDREEKKAKLKACWNRLKLARQISLGEPEGRAL